MRKMKWLFAAALVSFAMVSCNTDVTPVDEGEDTPPDITQDDLKEVAELASFDTTFNAGNRYPDQSWMSATVNYTTTFYDEFWGVKISVDEQKSLMKKADGEKIYISKVHAWPAATAQFSAIVYKGTQNAFKEISKGSPVNHLVDGNNWPRLVLLLDDVVEIKGDEDLFVGYYVANAAANSYPVTVMLNNKAVYPGREAKYPTYGLIPAIEEVMQEVNDPNDERWNSWVKDDANACVKVVISKEIKFN